MTSDNPTAVETLWQQRHAAQEVIGMLRNGGKLSMHVAHAGRSWSLELTAEHQRRMAETLVGELAETIAEANTQLRALGVAID